MQLIDGVVYKVKGRVGDTAFLYISACSDVAPKQVKFLYTVVSIQSQSFGRQNAAPPDRTVA